MKRERPALLVRVLTEIGKGRIYEGWIPDKEAFVHGLCDGKSIRVNPAVETVDTVLHEALHRLEPAWSERYVRNRTTFLLRCMSDEQIQQVYEEYQRLAKRRKKRERAAQRRVSAAGTGLVERRDGEGCLSEVRGRPTDADPDGSPGSAE